MQLDAIPDWRGPTHWVVAAVPAATSVSGDTDTHRVA